MVRKVNSDQGEQTMTLAEQPRAVLQEGNAFEKGELLVPV
jgi:hypothetical protein